MAGHFERDPVVETVNVLKELSEELYDAQPDEAMVEDDAAIDWVDQDSQRHYSLRFGFMGDVVVLESPDGDWNKGVTYRAGFSGLNIGSNETVDPNVPFHERFQPVINAMRAKLRADKQES